MMPWNQNIIKFTIFDYKEKKMCSLIKIWNESNLGSFLKPNAHALCDIELLEKTMVFLDFHAHDPDFFLYQLDDNEFYISSIKDTIEYKAMWSIQYKILSIDDLISVLKKINDDYIEWFECDVLFEDKKIKLKIELLPQYEKIIFQAIKSECYKLILSLDELLTSELEYVLFTDHGCPGSEQFPNGGFGSWLLRLTDKINIGFNIHKCFLTDAAYFRFEKQTINAAWLYAKTHFGLSYYMGHHYLSKEDTVIKSIRASNQQIEIRNEWWSRPLNPNTIIAKRNPNAKMFRDVPTKDIRTMIPMNSNSPLLVKYYKEDIHLYKPINNDSSQSAFFHLGPLTKEQIKKRNVLPAYYLTDLYEQLDQLLITYIQQYKKEQVKKHGLMYNDLFKLYKQINQIESIDNEEDLNKKLETMIDQKIQFWKQEQIQNLQFDIYQYENHSKTFEYIRFQDVQHIFEFDEISCGHDDNVEIQDYLINIKNDNIKCTTLKQTIQTIIKDELPMNQNTMKLFHYMLNRGDLLGAKLWQEYYSQIKKMFHQKKKNTKDNNTIYHYFVNHTGSLVNVLVLLRSIVILNNDLEMTIPLKYLNIETKDNYYSWNSNRPLFSFLQNHIPRTEESFEIILTYTLLVDHIKEPFQLLTYDGNNDTKSFDLLPFVKYKMDKGLFKIQMIL